MELLLIGGTATDRNTSRYTMRHNENAIPVIGDTPTGTGYMTHHRGTVDHQTFPSGTSNGAVFNTNENAEYRVIGNVLYKDGIKATGLVSNKQTSLPYSVNSQAIIDGGKLKYWRDDKLTELANWKEGEQYINHPDIKYNLGFKDTPATLATIPAWKPTGAFTIILTTDIKDKTSSIAGSLGTNAYVSASAPTGKQTILKGVGATATEVCELYLNVTEMAFYYISGKGATPVKISDAVDGVNNFQLSLSKPFDYAITQISDSATNYRNSIIDLNLIDLTGVDSRIYSLQEKVEYSASGEKPPTTKTLKNEYLSSIGKDGKIKTGSWVKSDEQDPVVKSPATIYDLDDIIDACRNRARYIAINEKQIIITDLENEQRPDRDSAIYTAESNVDKNVAVFSWNDYLAVFGKNSIEWFSLTGSAQNEYQSQAGMKTNCGAVGTHAVSKYGDNFVMLGCRQDGQYAVYVASPSKYQVISDSALNDIINTYNESELESATLEVVTYDNDDYIYLHLKNEVFLYSSTAQVWQVLKEGLYNDIYTGVNVVQNPKLGKVTIGNKKASKVGILSKEVSSIYGEPIEYVMYSAINKIGDGVTPTILGALSLESPSGFSNYAKSVFISSTNNGLTYGNEYQMPFDEKFDYTKSHLVRSLGMTIGKIGFKVRGITKTGFNISAFEVVV